MAMQRFWRRQSGATATNYGLVLGLIIVGCLGFIAATGGSISDLLGGSGNRLRDSAPEDRPPAPGPAQLGIAPLAGVDMDIDGPTALPGLSAPTVFTVTNSGGLASDALEAVLVGDFVFVPGGDGCTGQSLPPGQSCSVTVQARAYEEKPLAGSLHVTGLAEVPLAGTATGFEPALSFAEESTALTVDAACTPIRVLNLGVARLTGLSFGGFSGLGADSFDSCSQVTEPCGTSLEVQQGCNFGVRLIEPDDGTFTATATASASGGLEAQRGVFAEVISTTECPAGWTRWEENNHCYKISSAAVQRRDAYTDCAAQGGYLASVTGSGENAFLIATLQAAGIGGNTDIWIGLTRVGHNADAFLWDSGEAVGFTSWRGGEPNGHYDEFCGTYAMVDGNIGWNDLYCDRSARYICERLPPRTEGSAPEPTCPAGWYFTRATGNCYKRNDNALPYADARADCIAQGGYLSSITSDVENGYLVANLLSRQAWVGMTRAAPGSSDWVYESGETSSYARWGGGEPNNSGYDANHPDTTGENCVQYNNASEGRWNDLYCWQSQPYVCERPL